VQQSKAPLARETLLSAIKSNRTLLIFIVKLFEESRKLKIVHHTLSAFLASALVNFFQSLEVILDNDIRNILSLMLKGLETTVDIDLRSTMMLLLVVVSKKVKLEKDILHRSINCLIRGSTAETRKSEIMCLTAVFESQKLESMEDDAALSLAKQQDITKVLCDCSNSFRLDSFFVPFSKALVNLSVENQKSKHILTELLRLINITQESMEEIFSYIFKCAFDGTDKSSILTVAKELYDVHFKVIDSCINKILKDSSAQDIEKIRSGIATLFVGSVSEVIDSANTTLLLGLNHPEVNIRLMAIKKLKIVLESSTEHGDGELSFVADALLNRLNDEPGIVNQVLQIQNLHNHIEHTKLSDALCRIISNSDISMKKARKKAMMKLFELVSFNTSILTGNVSHYLLGGIIGINFKSSDSDLINALFSYINLDINSMPKSMQSDGEIEKFGILTRVIQHLADQIKASGSAHTMKFFLSALKSPLAPMSLLAHFVISRASYIGKLGIRDVCQVLEIIEDDISAKSYPESGQIPWSKGIPDSKQFRAFTNLSQDNIRQNVACITFTMLVHYSPTVNDSFWLLPSKDLYLDMVKRMFSLISKLSDNGKHLYEILLTRYVKSSIVDFLIFICTSVEADHVRVSALSALRQYFKIQANAEVALDFQMILPSLLTCLIDHTPAVREVSVKILKLMLVLYNNYEKVGGKQDQKTIYGYNTFYGSEKSAVEFLKLKTVMILVTQLVSYGTSIAADSDFLVQNLCLILESCGNSKVQDECVRFLTSHVVARPDESFRVKILLLLSNIDSASKVKSLYPLIKPEMERLNRDSQANPEFVVSLITTFFVSAAGDALKKSKALIEEFLNVLNTYGTDIEARVCKSTIQRLSSSWFGTLGLSTQQKVYSTLIHTISKAPVDVSSAAKATTSSLATSSQIVLPTLDYIVSLFQTEIPSKKMKKMSSIDESDPQSKIAILIAFLEHLNSVKTLHGWENLVPGIVSILDLIVNAGNSQVDFEYAKQLTLSVYERIMQKAPGISKLADNVLRADLVVQCIRITDNPQTHNAALLLLSSMANTHPSAVLVNIMPVFTFMGANVVRHDDNYSFQVVQRTLETIIPSLMKDGDQEPIFYVKNILDVFVNALAHVPSHRRHRLFTSLIETIGVDEYLGVLVALLLSNPLAVAEQSLITGGETINSRKFAFELFEQFGESTQFKGLESLIQIASQLPDEKTEKATNRILDTTILSTKTIRTAKIHVLQFVNAILQQKKNLAQKDGISLEEVTASLLKLQEIQILMVRQVQQKNTTSSYWSKVQGIIYENLSNINALIPIEKYVQVAVSLLMHESQEIRIHSLHVLNDRLTVLKPNSLPMSLFESVVRVLSKMIASDEVVADEQKIALSCAGSIAPVIQHTNHRELTDFMSLLLENSALGNTSESIRAQSMISLGSFFSVLGPRVVPHLQKIFPVVLDYMEYYLENDMENNIHVLSGAISCLKSAFESIPQFMSPFLKRTVLILADKRIHQNSNPELNKVVPSLIVCICEKVEHRVIFKVLAGQIETLMEMGIFSLHTGLVFLNELLTASSQTDVVAFSPDWVELFMKLLEFKKLMKREKAVSFRSLEDTILQVFTKFTLKMNEKAFKPVMLKIVDWSLSEENELDRRGMFFKLICNLVDSLKSIFVPYWSYFFDSIIDILQDTKISGKFGSLWTDCLHALLKLLSNDTVGFTTKERFEKLVNPLTDLIDMGDNEIPAFRVLNF
jgi:hypothetical protein